MFIHTKYCRNRDEVNKFIKGLKTEEVVTVPESKGYTVIYKSNHFVGRVDNKMEDVYEEAINRTNDEPTISLKEALE